MNQMKSNKSNILICICVAELPILISFQYPIEFNSATNTFHLVEVEMLRSGPYKIIFVKRTWEVQEEYDGA